MTLQTLKPFESKNKGFSLLELLAVVAIIGLLVTVAVPNYLKYKNHAKITAIHSEVLSIPKDFNICLTENLEKTTNDCADSVVMDYNSRILFTGGGHLSLGNNSSFFFSIDHRYFDLVCIIINQEGQLTSLGYKGVSANRKICYRNDIPHLPIRICNADPDCSAGSTCNYKTGTITSSPPYKCN